MEGSQHGAHVALAAVPLAASILSHKAPCNAAPIDVTLCFGRAQSFLLAAAVGEHPSQTSVGLRLLLQPIQTIQRMDLRRPRDAFVLLQLSSF